MMNNTLKAILLTSMLPFAANAAQELTPWYVGGGLGVNNYEPNCDQKTMKQCGEDDPYAWDVFGGYLFNDYFGVELGYRDLGRAEWVDYANKMNDVGARGMTLGLVGFWPIADRWSLSAEAGAMNYLLSNNKQWGSEYYSDSGVAPYFGAGIGYNFTDNLKLQAKYRRYENLDEDKWNTLNMESNYWGLELSYRFGRAASTPAPVAAPVVAAPKDSDNDGITDDKDQCANTPSNHKVDASGCTLYREVTEKHELGSIRFANDSAVVNSASYGQIEKLANYMNKNPRATVLIGGHASNVGNPDYNMKLSERRANAVAELLVSKYGISQDRVSAKGYGITQPLIEGKSAEANKANRRIEAHVTGVRKEAILK
ncbi:outer membrane beta-barrel protein [Shewanella insulae]|uniref:OmpA family protein n=1 Tax=Shewanella insulae TaxID=2681496 RepID=UPI001EFD7DC6|nr:OmpA family protein [Shewanella insulae]MCG9711335.1 outer membrane beta-barrel protein [Shewanella insulae]